MAKGSGILDLKSGGHLCLFYDDPAEQAPALVPFLKQGLDLGERVIYVADDSTTDDVRGWLESSGIDIQRQEERGALCLWTREQWLRPGDRDFDVKAVQFRQLAREADDSGFSGVRFGIEMTWALDAEFDADRLVQWESTLNSLFDPRANARIICQYSTRRLSSEALQAALRSHPSAVIGDAVCPNPYFEAPVILRGGGDDDRSLRLPETQKAHRGDELEHDRHLRDQAVYAESARGREQLDELRRASDEVTQSLHAARAAKDEFLALVSHELRTPLTMILGNAEVLQRRGKSLPESDRTAALDDLRTEAERLSGIVEHLLIVSRLGMTEEFEAEPVLPARVVEPLIARYGEEFEREVRLSGDTALGAWATRPAVSEIVENLVANAHQYSAAGEPIDVEVRRDGDQCRVSVLDRGIGVTDEEKEHVFEPFYRSPRVSQTQVRGLGIGLTACQRILAAHHGSIVVEKREGGGSVFSFLLPVVEMSE